MSNGLECVGLQPALRGKIADRLDAPVVRARVVLSGPRRSRRMSTLTGLEGTFLFSRVPPGIYTLEVECTNFDKLVQRGIAVQENAITGLDMRMDLEEDSRSLKLQSLRLDYVSGMPAAPSPAAPPFPQRQLRDVLDGLRLERALFNPPPQLTVGRRVTVEFGLFQSLRDEIVRGLLARRVDVFAARHFELSLHAELRTPGCLVLPATPPRVTVSGSGYLEWRWEIQPQAAGAQVICLGLTLGARVSEDCQLEKRLLALERRTRIRMPLGLRFLRLLKG